MALPLLDGTTGEGGGQVVRLAVCLAALTSQPIRITNIRGSRSKRGLKSQHFTAIQWLAQATEADVEGLGVGSHTLTFSPRRPPTELLQRNVRITPQSSASSILLLVQALLPFLLFAGNDAGDPIELSLTGGTNVSFSPSYEYFDQVFLPALEESFGVKVERELRQRGWSLGPQSRGSGGKLSFIPPRPRASSEPHQVKVIHASIVVPEDAHETLRQAVAHHVNTLFPGSEVNFKIVEDSKSDARWFIFLVAESHSGSRWAADVICSASKKYRSRDDWIQKVSRTLCQQLHTEVHVGGVVDEHLQDQLVCFQALCDGFSSFPRDETSEGPADAVASIMDSVGLGDSRMRREKTHEPFGHGSTHTKTARWVAAELLPKVNFFNKGDLVQGVGMAFD
ncbi:RNA 3'-terminal phosphate cyclase-domain-containing protein [Stachybotrys elegans]|uniref:RNA 3'-terminal phosphate cyclase-domain-containing protein n=1 Tax=Stachybotrys elegans TaxID=80388 RepID=A0A8K0STH9_9HYPO|nr:RNA 3'-terminal phosphate cyclase-domain-containing protein [Stachybotrys elegans]